MLIAVIIGLHALAATPHAEASEPGPKPFLVVSINTVTPGVVTATTGPVLTVTGTVSNVGDRGVRDIVARLERAAPIQTSAQLRTDLDGDTSQFQPVAPFVDVSADLQRGESADFSLEYPLRSEIGPALGLQAPGVYPLLVNVNGTPDYGAPARLDDARFLLPVVGLPAQVSPTGEELDAAVIADTTRPVQTTLLWPLADHPRLAPGVPGGTTPVRLMDDVLATSLAPGGRLDTLLGAAEFATSPAVDPDATVTRGICLAIDPDLLVTVNAMTAGYTVSDAADGLGTTSRPGTGQAAASAWLGRLRALAGRMCVVAAPYAQANLDALRRVGDARLSAFTVSGAVDVVEQLLGVPTTRGATLIGDGMLNDDVVDLLDAHGPTVAIAAADCVAPDNAGDVSATADVAPRRLSAQVVAAPFDPAVGAALAGAGNDPSAPSYLDSSLSVPLRHASAVARRQDAVAALMWRSLSPGTEPRTQILMPPLVWTVQPGDVQAVLTAFAASIRAGLSIPRPLTAVISETAGDPEPPRPIGAPDDDNSRGGLDQGIVEKIRSEIERLWGLTAALTTNAQTGLTGPQYTAPLREDMLRALSQSEPPDVREGLSARRLAVVSKMLDDLFGAVTIVNPGGSYTLATEHSPLPLALRNDLAVPIRVRLQVDAPPGMTVTDIGEQELPPGYLPVRVPIEVHFTQRVAVDVALRTPDGIPLGEPVRLSVHSNAYGKVLFFITLSAAAVLTTLTARRLWHRFRGQPDPADLDRPPRRRR